MRANATQIQPGWEVCGRDGQKIGSVMEVGDNYVAVEKGLFFITDLYVPTSAVDRMEPDESRVYLMVAKDDINEEAWKAPPSADEAAWEGWQARSQAGMWTPDQTDTARVPRYEEELRTGKVAENVGSVDVTKNVVEENKNVDVPVSREDVEVRRVPVDRPATGTEQAFQEGDTLHVPVQAERAEVHKEPRVVEEVEISKRRREETQRVGDTVRREEIDVSKTGDAKVSGKSVGDTSTSTYGTDPSRRSGSERDPEG